MDDYQMEKFQGCYKNRKANSSHLLADPKLNQKEKFS